MEVKKGKDERPQSRDHKLNYRYNYYQIIATYSTFKIMNKNA